MTTDKTDETEKQVDKDRVNLDNLRGSGEFSDDNIDISVPTLIEIKEKTPDLIQPDVIVMKSDESDVSEDARLLNTVPKSHIKKANDLLTVLNQRSSELTWNKDGVIIIDQIPIPGTNIFQLFRFLFIRKKPLEEKGFLELHDKIQSMGLSNLINIRHRIKEANVIKKVTKKDPSFWYLG